MHFIQRTSFVRSLSVSIVALTALIGGPDVAGQTVQLEEAGAATVAASTVRTRGSDKTDSRPTNATLARYYDPQQGTSVVDLIQRALGGNAEIQAARLDIARARARLRQAGLRPNPTLDFEFSTGRLTGSSGDRETSIGVSLPLEVGDKRKRRIELAEAELQATEAEVANRERLLVGEILVAYADALGALRELDISEQLNVLDLQTTRLVQVRVNEGETAPIELNLLQAEVERLRARRTLAEGRLQVALLRLRNLAALQPGDSLLLRETLTTAAKPTPPPSVESATEEALRTRPDVRFARLMEAVAEAGLHLAVAQGRPDLQATARYATNRSVFDETPAGPFIDRGRSLSFGVSVGIPVFNRNQGAKVEAATAITQARKRREFAETVVRFEVASAFSRYQAARLAVSTFERGVILRSDENIRVIRAAYELGQFSVTELITEQRRLVDSHREFIEALMEQYRSLADLQLAIGTPFVQPK